MIKLTILIVSLAGLLLFNWDKIPQPVKDVLWDAKTVSGEILEKGMDMPSPVKAYVDTSLTKKAKALKKIILE